MPPNKMLVTPKIASGSNTIDVSLPKSKIGSAPLMTFNFTVGSYKSLFMVSDVVAWSAAPQGATITCTKGSASQSVTAVNPKCPTGWKKK